jgi:dipeptidyl-peptidase-4
MISAPEFSRRSKYRAGIAALAIATIAAGALAQSKPTIPVELQTVAEKSDYRATARHAEIIQLLDRLAAASPLARRAPFGQSVEGREIPLLIISDPPAATSEEARVQVERDGKLLVFAIGNIHAGEVDGKEALPMVARELLLTPKHPLLKHLIVALAPIYNPDGNEQVSKENRPGQIGPEEGMGRRANGAGLDLNRDFIKLEAPETQSLVRFVNEWDPHVFIDTHTTNGCYHRYVITYEGPKSPAGSAPLVHYCRDQMMPAIARDMLRKYDVPSFIYGDFNRDHTAWETYPAEARYGTTYLGLRGRISVLSEGYSYAPYRTRVLGTRDFVKSILEYAADNREAIQAVLKQVDAETIAGNDRTVAIRSEAIAAPQKVKAAGFAEELRDGKSVPTSQPQDYEIELRTHFKSTLTVTRPFAYILPPTATRAIQKLAQHGALVEELTEPLTADAETYHIDSVRFANNPFQGHKNVRLETTLQRQPRTFPATSIVVRTGQKLGNLVVHLLEPQSEDGLTTWNFFDDALRDGGTFPVERLTSPTPIKSRSWPLATSQPAGP